MVITTEHLNGKTKQILRRVLIDKHVKVVIDVRWSDKWPEYFREASLKGLLRAIGIHYQRFEVLGNPPKNRNENRDDWRTMKREYLNYIQLHKGALLRLLKLIKSQSKDKVFCIICYCQTRNQQQCHRFWLQEHLEKELEKEKHD